MDDSSTVSEKKMWNWAIGWGDMVVVVVVVGIGVGNSDGWLVVVMGELGRQRGWVASRLGERGLSRTCKSVSVVGNGVWFRHWFIGG